MLFSFFSIAFLVFWVLYIFFTASMIYHITRFSVPGHRAPKLISLIFIILSFLLFVLSSFFLFELYVTSPK
ncbi:MAG: hypothetical protein A2847_01905 [Candidatus Sungbacteria bacterium RIFCSPHIGHO2_01_FULL_50_25]|uniref:Uncharacterized protein n=1 Tax=Candidatus Sungbacteria bacterium RIFCSPHIGHO2_01_FULL_50_25 TaxID=1802265 RepID=A0A1G2K929_9BACT|nr:MAG: hypothetical protein A2847_01905 [Candidatus Sungbacteria bacterium RIFCSPHIGHO2_01_FULL_50_25]